VGFGPPPAELPLPDRPSIAVLPFVNLSGDPAQDYFSDGITEDLTTDLARIPEIFVIARGSSFTYKGATPDPKVVGRELGVRYVVEGSVRRTADRVRITARLTDATQRHQLWSERYDRKLEDLFSLQSEISLQILGSLKLGLREAELRRLIQRPERDLRAHDAVLRGFAQIERQTRAGLREGRRLFAHATELDPSYAEAWAFLGMTYAIEYTAAWDREPTVIDRARELGNRALDLNPDLPAAWALLATTELWRGHTDAAVAAAQRAVELAPSLDSPYHFLGLALAADGRFLAALDQIQTAMRINPRSPHSYKVLLSFVNWRVGRLDEAIVLWEDLRRANRDLVLPRIGLATAYEERGAHAEAQRVAAEILRVNPELTAEVAARAIPARLSASRVAGIEATLLRAGLP
jgi:adenylate cyclase